MSTRSVLEQSKVGCSMDVLQAAVRGIVSASPLRISTRNIFYELVKLNLIENTERVFRLLSCQLEQWGDKVLWSTYADNVRRHLGGVYDHTQHGDLVRETGARARQFWIESHILTEIWSERESTAVQLAELAAVYGVPVYPPADWKTQGSMQRAKNEICKYCDFGNTVNILIFADHYPQREAASCGMRGLEELPCLKNLVVENILSCWLQGSYLPRKPKAAQGKASEQECVEIEALSTRELRDVTLKSLYRAMGENRNNLMDVVDEVDKKSMMNRLGCF